MKKLRLMVESLAVETFDPAAAPLLDEGTVHGQEATLRADTCGCPDTSIKVPCFCTEYATCWDCT